LLERALEQPEHAILACRRPSAMPRREQRSSLASVATLTAPHTEIHTRIGINSGGKNWPSDNLGSTYQDRVHRPRRRQ
jgi:hypothetical protein